MVLGKCHPDEITVRRSWDDKLSVEQKVIGDKELSISLACTYHAVVDCGSNFGGIFNYTVVLCDVFL